MAVNDKVLLQRLRELLIERKDQLDDVDKDTASSEKEEDSHQNMDKSSASKQLTLGAHPGSGLNFNTSEVDNIPAKNGYSTVFMLSFLTFFFEAAFLLISYFIFK